MTKLTMNNQQPKVSVTVPVYNTSRYLDICVTSLVNQTLRDIEIILVDDGSTDGSGEMCNLWSQKDPRIKVIHQKNGGTWQARQTGLNNASGEYLIVCDSDDWVETTAYEKAYNKAKEHDADLVFFGYNAEYPDGTSHICIRNFSDLNNIELTREEIMRYSYYHTWDKLIRRTLFIDNAINYEPGINMGEDHLILQKILFIRPLKIKSIPEALYHYRINSGGYTTHIKSEHIEQLINVLHWNQKHLDNRIYADVLAQKAINLAFESFRCENFSNRRFQNLLKEITISHLCRSPRSPQKLIVLIGKIWGWKLGHWTYKNIYAKKHN